MQDLEDGQIDEPEERDSIPSPPPAPPPGLYYLNLLFPFSEHFKILSTINKLSTVDGLRWYHKPADWSLCRVFLFCNLFYFLNRPIYSKNSMQIFQ